ncbi:Y+L amino acid transporter 1 [Armadillidium vulgare]|nr:Y+L amino acid transporter 1 [Armadillidium vulgare]
MAPFVYSYHSILESDVMRRNADTAKFKKGTFQTGSILTILWLKNSSRFATGKLVTSIGIKETEKESVTQEKGTKLSFGIGVLISHSY